MPQKFVDKIFQIINNSAESHRQRTGMELWKLPAHPPSGLELNKLIYFGLY